jgi:hypothetical protein
MREEGMFWSAREVSPLDKTEILDKTKSNEKILFDKVESFGIKENNEKIPLDKALRFGIKEN